MTGYIKHSVVFTKHKIKGLPPCLIARKFTGIVSSSLLKLKVVPNVLYKGEVAQLVELWCCITTRPRFEPWSLHEGFISYANESPLRVLCVAGFIQKVITASFYL